MSPLYIGQLFTLQNRGTQVKLASAREGKKKVNCPGIDMVLVFQAWLCPGTQSRLLSICFLCLLALSPVLALLLGRVSPNRDKAPLGTLLSA